MRATAIAALAALLTATPALAQVTASDVGPTADRDFWCAAAFGMLSYTLQSTGDAAGADKAHGDMQTIFAGIAAQMQANGMERADYDALVTAYTARAMNPFTAAAYTQDECNTAVSEAPAPAPAEETGEPDAETAPAP